MFIKTLIKKYTINLALSFVLAVVIIALRLETNIINVILVLAGSLLGTFLLDLDYLVFAFIVEPNHHFSQRLRELVVQKNLDGALLYIDHNKSAIPRLTLHSALFQSVLAVITLYVLTSSNDIFGQAFVISGFLQSIYKVVDEYQQTKNVDRWFWILKEKPTKNMLYGYFSILIVVFLYSLSFIG